MLSRRRKSITGRAVVAKQASIKPSKARKIIRRYHVLIHKRELLCRQLGIPLSSAADEEHNTRNIHSYLTGHVGGAYADQLRAIQQEITEKGGLEAYQMASKNGQRKDRGGDSSKRLVQWLRELGYGGTAGERLRALEIGSLSSDNCISHCSMIDKDVVRIDLNSHPEEQGILQQDFMERPRPRNETECFDVISCSLVLNFVPTPQQRGAMCKRFAHFFRPPNKNNDQKRRRPRLLFLVLPLPCVTNSRYMDTVHLQALMATLGYTLLKQHESAKLCYMLFDFTAERREPAARFTTKTKLHDRKGMNNFCILLSS